VGGVEPNSSVFTEGEPNKLSEVRDMLLLLPIGERNEGDIVVGEKGEMWAGEKRLPPLGEPWSRGSSFLTGVEALAIKVLCTLR